MFTIKTCSLGPSMNAKILICRGLSQITTRKSQDLEYFSKNTQKIDPLNLFKTLDLWSSWYFQQIIPLTFFSVMSSFNDNTYLPKVLNCQLKCATLWLTVQKLELARIKWKHFWISEIKTQLFHFWQVFKRQL